MFNVVMAYSYVQLSMCYVIVLFINFIDNGSWMMPEREEKVVWVDYVNSDGVTCDEEVRLPW